MNITNKLAGYFVGSALVVGLALSCVTSLYADANGRSGRTLKTSTSGCGSCHGSSATPGVAVAISGPATLNIGETGRYSVSISNVTSNTGGIDIAVSSGSLIPVSTTLKTSNGELVHRNTVNVPVTFEFDLAAPTTPGNLTIYATGKGTDTGWNWAPNFDVKINDVLPVELSSFNALVKGNRIELVWRTQTESNNYGFEIERKSASGEVGNDWLNIGFVQGHGSTSSPNDYVFVDKTVTGGAFHYRLKQIDTGGTFAYSNEIAVSLAPEVFSLQQNFPNPFNPITRIEYVLPQDAKVVLRVYDIVGNEVKTLVNAFQSPGVRTLVWDGTDNLNQPVSSGVYISHLQADGFSQTRKMTLLK